MAANIHGNNSNNNDDTNSADDDDDYSTALQMDGANNTIG